MTNPGLSIDFFRSFIEKHIDESCFIENLQQLTTQIQQKNSLNNDQLNQIFQYSLKLSDQTYNANIELFVKFSMYMADKGIYGVFESYEFNFDHNYDQGQTIDVNIVALYIISRVYKTENPKVLLLFLNGLIAQVKHIEKKYVLLEFYISIIPIIDKKEIHYQDILPLILKVINEGLEKYFQYVKQQKDGDLNQKNQFVLSYLKNFQKWTVNILQRVFQNLNKTNEIQQVTECDTVQNLLTINDIYDYDDLQDKIVLKAEAPALAVKHLVLLFLFDLIHGILEAKMSAETNNIEPKILSDLYQQIISFLNKIHSNKLELIENYLQFVRFSLQRDIPMTRQIHRYNLQLNYNPVTMAHLTSQILFGGDQEYINIQKLLTFKQKLKLAIGVLYESKFIQSAKTNVQESLVYSIANLIAQNKGTVSYIGSPAYFITHFYKLVLLFLEKAGSGLPKEEEVIYIEAWKNMVAMMSLECYTVVVQESLSDSDNIQLLAHLTNHYRSILSLAIKTDKSPSEEYFRFVDVLHKSIQKKTQVGTIDTKIQVIDSIILIQKTLILNYQPKTNIQLASKYYDNWRKQLTQYEKEIQQSLDYINKKKIQKQKDDEKQTGVQQGDLVYQQLQGQENVIQIVYYNLQDLISLYSN